MSEPGDLLSDEEVRQISRIIEALNRSDYDYLQLEFGNLKLTIGKGGPPIAEAPAAPLAAVAATARPTVAAATHAAEPDDGSVEIVAPMIGHFYSQSEPGAAPYVSVGSEVHEETTVGLIEAMKMFNAVHSGVTGVITRICVQDATLVEYGQVLFRVLPK